MMKSPPNFGCQIKVRKKGEYNMITKKKRKKVPSLVLKLCSKLQLSLALLEVELELS